MDYRYKPGDRVVVINGIQESADYYMRSGSLYPHRNVICVSESTILEYCRNRYVIKETDKKILWTDDMFVGLANEKECCCESLL